MLTRTSFAASMVFAIVMISPAGVARAQDQIAALCGEKPAIVALTDGFGDSIWRRITRAEFEEEASKCKNITKVLYADANGNPQKSNADINGLAAQGVNVLVSFADFGDAMLPAFRKAYQSGVVDVPYLNKISGQAGKDYAANVYQDNVRVAELWAEWIGRHVQKGGVIVIGGASGAPTSQTYIDTVRKTFKAKFPEMQVLNDDYLISNWNPSDSRKAVTGAIAKYGDQIKAVVADYGVSALATVRAYEEAGLPVPPIATIATSNELMCKYLDAKNSGKAFHLFSIDHTTSTVRIALRRALSIYEGTVDPEKMTVVPPVYVDSFEGADPICDASAPPDADLSSTLPKEKLKALFVK